MEIVLSTSSPHRKEQQQQQQKIEEKQSIYFIGSDPEIKNFASHIPLVQTYLLALPNFKGYWEM